MLVAGFVLALDAAARENEQARQREQCVRDTIVQSLKHREDAECVHAGLAAVDAYARLQRGPNAPINICDEACNALYYNLKAC